MKWLDNLLGRPDSGNGKERAEDERAIQELRASVKHVRGRTDRLIEAYREADAQRRKRRDAAT